MRLKIVFSCLFAFLSVLSVPAIGQPIDDSFTYQGQLQDGGASADGLYDFEVMLVDGLGVDLGIPPLAFGNVAVTDGLFTLELNFGEPLSSDNKSFLKISVGPAGGALVELLPHTVVNSVPLAAVAQEAVVATFSLDNEFDRDGNILRLGNISERVLINPNLSGNAMINGSTDFQINFDSPTYGGMYLNGSEPTSIPFYGFAQSGSLFSWMEAVPADNEVNFWFTSEAAPSLTLRPTQVEASSLVVNNTIQADGEIIQEYGNNNYHYATPIAYGTFSQISNQFFGTENLSVMWNADSSRYELTLDGEFFTFIGYTVNVTVAGPTPRIVTTDSGLQKLLVYIFDLNGNRVQGNFQVIIYKGAEVLVP